MIIKPIYTFIFNNNTTVTTYDDLTETNDNIIGKQQQYAIIADENKILTDGNIYTTCIYVNSTEGWSEIDAPLLDID